MGGLIYHDGKLVSIDTPEGRAVPLDSTNQDFTYQFFYNDHLGNLRVAYSVAPNGAIITQENHYGPMGELLEGISSNSESYPYLFQGKEREFSWGLGLDDFMTRTYDPFTGRMWQVDGADQFASGYVGMGNNAINGIDPDGQWLHILAGAVINVGIGLATGEIKDWKDAASYAAIGAVSAAVGGFAVKGALKAVGWAASSVRGSAMSGAVGGFFGGGLNSGGNATHQLVRYGKGSWQSVGKSALIGATMGAAIGGGIGYYFGKNPAKAAKFNNWVNKIENKIIPKKGSITAKLELSANQPADEGWNLDYGENSRYLKVTDYDKVMNEMGNEYISVFHKGNLSGGMMQGNRSLSTGLDRNSVNAIRQDGKLWEFKIPRTEFNQWESQRLIERFSDLDFSTVYTIKKFDSRHS